MTGFGQSSRANERHQVTVSLRSVNHRALDISVRLREELRAVEAEVRRLVVDRVQRGRIDVSCEVQALTDPEVSIHVSLPSVGQLKVAAEELRSRHGIAGEIHFRDLLQLPDVVSLRSCPVSWTDDDQELLLGAVEEALAGMMAARQLEGEQLGAIIAEKLAQLKDLVERIAERAAEGRAAMRDGIERRLVELLDGRVALDQGRLLQEAAILAERADVAEELDRLGAHIVHLRATTAAEGSIGKRLDFLLQEVMRELNTVGAKARDAETTAAVVDAKLVCEQLREQVQNVE